MSKRGNKAWGSGKPAVNLPDQPTKFEKLVKQLGLEDQPELWAQSMSIRRFVMRWSELRYIPEQLLVELKRIGETEDLS